MQELATSDNGSPSVDSSQSSTARTSLELGANIKLSNLREERERERERVKRGRELREERERKEGGKEKSVTFRSHKSYLKSPCTIVVVSLLGALDCNHGNRFSIVGML